MTKRSKQNILFLTYWSLNDPLVQVYTLPYIKIIRSKVDPGSKMFLMTLDQITTNLTDEAKADHNKFRKELKELGVELISFTYSRFGWRMILESLRICLVLVKTIVNSKVGTIHAWCTPAGGFGYILSKITGTRLILDSYEPHAEPMVQAGEWSKNSLAFKLLWWLERKQTKRADVAIACVESMKGYAYEKYGTLPKKFFWKPAAVDVDNFNLSLRKDATLLKKFDLENKIVYVYAGKLGGSYLQQEVFDLIRTAQDFYGRTNFRFLLLNKQESRMVQDLSEQAGVSPEVVIHLYVGHHEIPKMIGLGDVGLVPFKPVPSKRYGSPIKTGEYMSMGLPMIISRDISDDSDIIRAHGIGFVMNEWNQEEYQSAIKAIDILRQDKPHSRISKIALKYKSFRKADMLYDELY